VAKNLKNGTEQHSKCCDDLVKGMEMHKGLITFLVIIVLAFSVVRSINAQTEQNGMQTFLDSTAFGLRIQANATAEVLPNENITVTMTLIGQTEVQVKYLNLSVFGFLNGTDRILIANRSDVDFPVNDTSWSYNCTFDVPEWVSGKAYGEIRLAHSAKYGPVTVNNDGLVCGFYMTNVKNVYLQGLEQQLNDLKQKYEQLNQTYGELERNFTALQETAGELDNTRRVTAVLGITTVFFVATTLYLVFRRPKEYW
jgi:hypothetical protein